VHEMMISNQHFDDLNPLLFGRMKCVPGYHFGPAIRNYVLIHYVESGCGVLYKNNRSYPVHKGQAFIILKGEITSYVADRSEPWEYRWIGFDGKLSSKYSTLPSVLDIHDSIFPNVTEKQEGFTEYVLASQLFRMTAELFADENHANQHIRRVKNYIKHAYMNNITVEQIAASIPLDRRYLTRIFKRETGMTVQEYIISIRMKNACDLLEKGKSVVETAMLCGYTDTCNFSKMFKRTYGVSPGEYRRQVGPSISRS